VEPAHFGPRVNNQSPDPLEGASFVEPPGARPRATNREPTFVALPALEACSLAASVTLPFGYIKGAQRRSAPSQLRPSRLQQRPPSLGHLCPTSAAPVVAVSCQKESFGSRRAQRSARSPAGYRLAAEALAGRSINALSSVAERR